MPDLKVLREKREEILKAELAAWLHDARKAGIKKEWLPDGFKKWLEARDVTGIHLYEDDFGKWLLAQAHGIAHFDKQNPDKQSPESQYISTPFGFENSCSQRLRSQPQWTQSISNLWNRNYARQVLSNVYADGRIPINEISLWSWSETTCALTKSSWILALLNGIDLTRPLLKPSLLEQLDNQMDILLSRQAEAIKTMLKELQSNIQTNSPKPFRGLRTQISKDGEEILPKFVQFLDSWLKKAQEIRTENRLTQNHWAQFLDKLQRLLSHLQQALYPLSWRLLSIRTNGLEYLLSAPSIPDLKARQELLRDAWNKVQALLEVEYPLALEVYRDENGPVFVVPDIDNLLGLTDSDRNAQTLREFILERFRQGTVQNDPCLALEGEIVPTFKLDVKPWKGQPVPQELPPIWDHVRDDATPPLKSDPHWVAAQWCHLPTPQERCTVCGLRPQGPSPKARRRGRCDVCEKRRVGRAKTWAANIGRAMLATIWLDEVADHNGRIALLVGTFDLKHWLNGTLVRSLAVRTPNDQNGHTAEDVAKNPSFARLRRIWETTRRFWEEALKDAEQGLGKRPRIFLKGRAIPINPDKEGLAPYHAYELEIQGRKVAVLWVPEDAMDEEGNDLQYRGGFWVIENLEYLDNVYGRRFQDLVQELAGQPLKVYEPTEYGRPGQEQATFTIALEDGVQYLENNYTPLIPILAEPRTFMALVPAEKALDVVKAIKAKYEREMGRVRNRLPLHLGVVFADSHQPLRTILDAGRRMLKQGSLGEVEKWHVMEEVHKQAGNLPSEVSELAQETKQFDEWFAIHLEHEVSKREVTWYLPAVMGDGQTEDHWYPYVFLASPDEPTDRTRYYKTDLGNPWNANYPWLVHAAELQRGDHIFFTPATFDFIFLDHGGRRFEIAYDEQGRRRGTLHRPYLLDEIEDLETCWRLLAGVKRRVNGSEEPIRRLSSRQLHQIRDLIETKRAEWFEKPEDSLQDETFRRFCADVLQNAEWTTRPTKQEIQRLTQWAVSGLLADAVELFYHIMKQRPMGETDEDTGSAST